MTTRRSMLGLGAASVAGLVLGTRRLRAAPNSSSEGHDLLTPSQAGALQPAAMPAAMPAAIRALTSMKAQATPISVGERRGASRRHGG